MREEAENLGDYVNPGDINFERLQDRIQGHTEFLEGVKNREPAIREQRRRFEERERDQNRKRSRDNDEDLAVDTNPQFVQKLRLTNDDGNGDNENGNGDNENGNGDDNGGLQPMDISQSGTGRFFRNTLRRSRKTHRTHKCRHCGLPIKKNNLFFR
jgi:hypothetical protein